MTDKPYDKELELGTGRGGDELGKDVGGTGANPDSWNPEERSLSESLSAWIDGEEDLTGEQLDRLLANDNLRRRWGHYHLIGQCLSERSFLSLNQSVPGRRFGFLRRSGLSRWSVAFRRPPRARWMAGTAAALCFAILVSFLWGPVGNIVSNPSLPVSGGAWVASRIGSGVEPATRNGTALRRPTPAPLLARHPDLKKYLVHHSAYLSSVGAQGNVPHARLISATEER